MKKTFLILIMLLAVFDLVHAQRHLQGQKGIELSVGRTWGENFLPTAFYLQAGMTVAAKKENYMLWALDYSRRKQAFEGVEIPLECIAGEGSYNVYLLGDWSRTVSLYLGLGAVAGYEIINESKKVLSMGAVILNEDRFIYGGGVRLSLETYVGNRVVLLVQGKARYIMGTTLERLRPGAGVGVRFIF